jgi:hypothetical protein
MNPITTKVGIATTRTTVEALTDTKYGQIYGHAFNYLPPVSDEALLAWLSGKAPTARP